MAIQPFTPVLGMGGEELHQDFEQSLLMTPESRTGGWVSGAFALAAQAWKSQIARGSAPLIASSVLAVVVTFARTVVAGRALGSDLFGLLAYGLALSLLIPQLLNLQTGDTIIRFLGAKLARMERTAAMTFLQLGLVLEMSAAVIALLGIRLIVFPIASTHPEHDLLQSLITIYLPAVPVIMLRRPLNAALVALQRFKLAALIQVLGSVLDLGAVVLGIPGGVLSIAGLMACSAAAISVLTAAVASESYNVKL